MLTTENAGGVVAGASNAKLGYHTVEILKGTYVHSVGRNVKADEVVEVSDADYRFLKPYGFCKDSDGEAVEPVAAEADEPEVVTEPETEDNDLTDKLVEEITEFVTEVTGTVKGKRK
jgi:hypothetical protein